MPRWVKISGAVVALLVVVVIAIIVLSGGKHGPGRHGAEGADRIRDTSIALSYGASG